jgi:DNA-binding GntR family transcriptional regulator
VKTLRIPHQIENQRIADQAFIYIKRLILSGELRGGERIPEESLAHLFKVSRTPIREAMKKLETYGLVDIRPRSYAEVSKLEPGEAVEISLIRSQIEELSVSILSERGTEEDFEAIEQLAVECTKHLDQGEISICFEIDSQLHLEIAKRTAHRHLYDIFERIDAKVQLLRLAVHLPVDVLHVFLKHHYELIEAMKKRDGERAKVIIRKHIMSQLKHSSWRQP